MKVIIAALLAASSCAAFAQAQTAPPVEAAEVLTLDHALMLAGQAAPANDVAAADLRAAGAARTAAGLRPNPSIAVEAENIAGSGAYRDIAQAETMVSLAMPIEMGGKRRARMAVADAEIDRAAVGAAILAADLRLAVTQAYVAAIAADRRLAVADRQVGIAAEAARAAAIRVQAGRASPFEVQRAEVARGNAETAAERAARLAAVARQTLARRIGRPVTGALDGAWFDRIVQARSAASRSVEGPARHAAGPDDGTATLEFAAANADLVTAEASVRLARSQRVPDLTLSTGARRFEATNDTAALVSLSIPIPLFDRGSAAVAEAGARRDGAEARRRVVALEIAQAIAEAQAAADNAGATALTASGPVLVAAEESARIARIGYREGKFGQLDLLDAERTLAETRAAAIDALAAYHDAEARLARLTAPAPEGSGR